MNLNAQPMNEQEEIAKTENNAASYLKAVRLFNTADDQCSFELGKIPTGAPIKASHFFAQTKVEAYEMVPHPAPRCQYVITLKGRLRFEVSNGDSFIIEPGIILVAEDIKGKGHTWKLIDGEQWERLYIPFEQGTDNHFVVDEGC